MAAVRVVSSDAPPASSIASPAATACSRLPQRDPRLDAERVGARERHCVRAAVGLPGAQPAEQRRGRSRAGRCGRGAGFSTATVPSSRSVRKTSSCEPASGPGTSRRSVRPPPASERVRPRLALRRRQARRVLPGLGQRHDRARRSVQPAAGLEERRADDAVVPPDEVVRLAARGSRRARAASGSPARARAACGARARTA